VTASRFGVRDVREMYIHDFESPPAPELDPKILLMCRVWDPVHTPHLRLRDDRERVNEMRAACIRAGRAEFGDRFYGGLAHGDFSREHYGDCLLPSARDGERHAFLARVRDSAICVSTSGLHQSIGWKMAEYVASSRAILAESLHYVVPGGFAPGRNLIEFDSVDGFIAAAERLMRDHELRSAMMHANWDYYREWVRPDAQVLRTLEVVLGLREGDASGRASRDR
jgi:hypothetical protein